MLSRVCFSIITPIFNEAKMFTTMINHLNALGQNAEIFINRRVLIAPVSLYRRCEEFLG